MALPVILALRGVYDWLMAKFGPCALCGKHAEIRQHGLYYCSVEHAEEGLAEDMW